MGLVRGVLGLFKDLLIGDKCFTCPIDCDHEDFLRGGEGVVIGDKEYNYGNRRAAGSSRA